ncbi:MAG: hypothetical protein HY094_09835 [Candidatus Melainabacteria bacterium]|nr:hypothetical protein [Candidatus Melainabacteria bacterium]
MKYSKSEIRILFLFFLLLAQTFSCIAQEADLKLRVPLESKGFEENIPSSIDIKKLPNFPNSLNKKSPVHKVSASASTIPVDTRLRLSVDTFIDAKTSMVGDYFKAHVLEDFYIPTDPPQLIVSKGSWVRGRISYLKRPNIFSMAGKIGLHLYQLVTPLSEVATLDAELDVQKGVVNNEGLLDPMTNFGTKAIEPTQMLLDSSQGRIISVATLGTPVIGTLIAGTLTALFSQGDNITLNRGQELQIVLQKDLQLTVD